MVLNLLVLTHYILWFFHWSFPSYIYTYISDDLMNWDTYLSTGRSIHMPIYPHTITWNYLKGSQNKGRCYDYIREKWELQTSIQMLGDNFSYFLAQSSSSCRCFMNQGPSPWWLFYYCTNSKWSPIARVNSAICTY